MKRQVPGPVVPLAGAQWYAPQSDRDLRLTGMVETMSPQGVRIQEEVKNLSGLTASRVTLRGANEVASGTCRGTWSMTPDVMKEKKRIRFVGEPPEEPPARQ